jgi:orotate phosphoribosyltransferase
VTDRERLAALLRERSLAFGDFTLASGRRSSYYIDARPTTMSAEGIALIGRLGLAAIRGADWEAQIVGGLTRGADPVAYAIARASLDSPPVIDAFSVRKAPKQHGGRQQIEGNFSAGAALVVVEDVVTSGASAIRAIQVLEAAGGKVLGVLAVVDREQGGRAALRDAGFEIVSITTISEIGVP